MAEVLPRPLGPYAVGSITQEFRSLEGQLTAIERKQSGEQLSTLQRLRGQEQQKAACNFYQNARNTNNIVHARAMDGQFVLQRLRQLLSAIPGIKAKVSDETPNVITAIGLSLGGAVSMELAKLTNDITRVVNIDGGIFGELQSTPLTTPSLMIYSEQNEAINELALSKSDNKVTSETISGSKHLNFHDIALIFPRLLKIIGALGKRSAKEVINSRNEIICTFIG